MTVPAKLSNADRTLIIRVPMPPRRREARKFVVGPGGVAWTGRRVVVDNTIVKALGRAHRWKAMLESGDYGSMTDLAQAEKINLSYLCRVLRLTLLAPDITQFDFEKRYGTRGRGFIEVHHIKAVATLVENSTTKLEDLALVCANCHRMIHAQKPWLSIEELRATLC
jgi:HNH endonuclease